MHGTVHVVDDDTSYRVALCRLLSAAGLEPVPYGSAVEYLATDDPRSPACVLLDLRMPGFTGLDLQRTLATRSDAHPVIFLSAHGDIPTTVRAMQGGALDFLTKPVPTVTLLEAIHRALVADVDRQEHAVRMTEIKRRYASLTARERQVMAGVVAGLLNKQICFTLQAAERTVKTHRSRVMEKMQARSVAELVRLAEELAAAGVTLAQMPAA